MLEINVDGVDRITRRLERMQRKLEHFEGALLHEVRDWEVQDVHRKQPGAHGSRDGTVIARVIFRPHSRYEMKRSMLARRRLHYKGRTSTRDILRKQLIDRLIVRLNAKIEEELKW
jgi:hypothetical protein